MGIKLFSDCSCSCEKTARTYLLNTTSVDPNSFKIQRCIRVGNYTVVEINYPDCTNYEGNKILVYEDLDIIKLTKLFKIDPHFCDNGTHPSPIARFEPTKRGWNMALMFARMLFKND